MRADEEETRKWTNNNLIAAITPWAHEIPANRYDDMDRGQLKQMVEDKLGVIIGRNRAGDLATVLENRNLWNPSDK